MTGDDELRMLFDVSPRPSFVFDRETLALVDVNQACCALYGWSRDELLAMTLRDLRQADESSKLDFALARERLHSKTAFSRTSRHSTKTGRIIDVDVDMVRITYRDRPCTLASVTELTGAAEVERRFRVLVEHSADGILTVDKAGRFSYLSPGAERILGVRTGELVGELASSLRDPDDRSPRVGPKPGETVVNTARVRHKSGSWLWTESTTTNLLLDPGIRAFVTNVRDITERRELFARVATADRLVALGTLAAGVAHEINNPLAYVMANLELLAREMPALLSDRNLAGTRYDRDQFVEFVADAREGAERVRTIVCDLNALTRPPNDGSGPVDVVAILVSSIKMASSELRHRARVVEDYAADLPRVDANASRLGQVFLNLLVNAAHAFGEPQLDRNEVRVRATSTTGTVIVEIEDNGVGIAPEIVGRIFDPFFTTKPVGVGIGLGLAISHQIVQSIGGEIHVTSGVGSGTTLRVVLPASTG